MPLQTRLILILFFKFLHQELPEEFFLRTKALLLMEYGALVIFFRNYISFIYVSLYCQRYYLRIKYIIIIIISFKLSQIKN